MSFAFNFDGDDIVQNEPGRTEGDSSPPSPLRDTHGSSSSKPTKKHTLEELISSLPSRISYSSVDISSNQRERIRLFRRDLFDARFQMIHEEDPAKENSVDQDKQRWHDFTAGEASDLVPGEYEGGLKTWECSLDLVSILAKESLERHKEKANRVLELGCGTAMPSLFLLSRAFREGAKQNMELVLCDFNEQVFRLVTLPNILVNWYFSTKGKDGASESGELELTEELFDEFQSSMTTKGINVTFYSGPWEGLALSGALSKQYDVVLTSETIYSMDSLSALVDVLETACCGSLEGKLDRTRLQESHESHTAEKDVGKCLVAAKVLYFGVGGGVLAFEQELHRRRANAATVWKSEQGVSRVVLEVRWHRS